jgi:phytoene dehydrogenase-like protein
MMPKSLRDKNIIIVGTGVGGAGIAALLANDGAKPVVLERNSLVGGKACSVNIKGCMVDAGIHLTPRGEKGPIAQLAKKVNADLSFVTHNPFLKIKYRKKEAVLTSNLGNPLNLAKAFWAMNPSLFSIPGALRFFLKLRSIKCEKDLSPYYGKSAKEMLNKYIKNSDLLSLMTILGGWMHVLVLEHISAADFLWAMANWFRDGATAYPKGGYYRVCKSYLDICEKHGGSVRLNEKVERIVVIDNMVKGIETDKGFVPAEIIISNAGIRKTVELVGESHFPESYAKKAKSYKNSMGGIVVQYGLDYRPVDTLLSLVMKDKLDGLSLVDSYYKDNTVLENIPIAFVCPTLADPDLAPQGQHLLLAGISYPEDILDGDKNSRMLDAIEALVIENFPGIEEHILWKVRRDMNFYANIGGRGTGEIVGWAQKYDQDGPNRMSARTPVEGLYVVGTDTGYVGIGTELAAESSLRAHKLILEDF